MSDPIRASDAASDAERMDEIVASFDTHTAGVPPHLRDDPPAATAPGLGWVSLHRHVEAARRSIAGARLRKSLLVVTPSEYEALMDIVDAANRTGDDVVLAAVTRWKDSHAID